MVKLVNKKLVMPRLIRHKVKVDVPPYLSGTVIYSGYDACSQRMKFEFY